MAVNITAIANVDLAMGRQLINALVVVDRLDEWHPSPVFVSPNITRLVNAFSNGGAYITYFFQDFFNIDACL